MALVICCVFLTARIRRRRSISEGMSKGRLRLQALDSGRPRALSLKPGAHELRGCIHAALAFLEAKSPANSLTAASSAAFS